ncbi:MAG: OadG family protein [Dialister invisus]|nr:OadG family protein [Dialister invisus]
MFSSGEPGRTHLPILERWILFMDTPGPLSICLTNMVIVFAVLIFLAFVIELIHVVDPTKKKK